MSEINNRLHEVAALLRDAKHLDADAQRQLADLMDELSAALAGGGLDEAEVAHLTQSTAQLAKALHAQQDEHVTGAKERLEQALLDLETRSPFVTGVLRRLLDVLAGLGI